MKVYRVYVAGRRTGVTVEARTEHEARAILANVAGFPRGQWALVEEARA